MEPARKLLQIVRFALLGSILLYVFVGERVAQKPTVPPDRNIYFAVTLVAIINVGMMIALRRLFVRQSETILATQPEDRPALNRWRTGYIIVYALSEAEALFGFVLRILGFTLSQVMPFYVVGFALLLAFGPTVPPGEIG